MAVNITKIAEQSRVDRNPKAFALLTNQLRTFAEEARSSGQAMRILKSLHFKQIKERQSTIAEAHKNTFEWVFDAKSDVNFVPWLRTEGEFFWVTGKPGSGKSTLMKFIQRHPHTEEILRQWAGRNRLILASHYFWIGGHSLQKSQDGLLRTLLFQVLAQCPEIIPAVCPERWNEFKLSSFESWDRKELLDTLIAVSHHSRLIASICFFIDGLDEYNGNHRELAKILKQISRLPNIKICASSRPWQEFVDAFDDSDWKLQVHDLTKTDIACYVQGQLMDDELFRKLQIGDPRGASALVHQIREKAQGVFLWVYLVVRSLLQGLVHEDEMLDLHRRVNALPAELEEYFELMLGRIESVYRTQTARIFKALLNACATLPLIAFHFVHMEEQNPGYVLSQEVRPLSNQEISTILVTKKRQLNARCKDLVHITSNPDEPEFIGVRVGFLHRTVKDFLETAEIHTLLSNRTGNTYDSNSSLSKAYLSMAKAYPYRIGTDSYRMADAHRSFAIGTIYYARAVEQLSQCPEEDVLDELNRTLCALGICSVWTDLVPSGDCDNFLDVALRFDLQLYIEKKLNAAGADKAKIMTRLLWQALRDKIVIENDFEFETKFKGEIDLSALEFLLEHGADPNSKVQIKHGSQYLTLEDRENKRFGNPDFVLELQEKHPEDRRSVWGDFLLQLRTDLSREQGEQWDMSQYLESKTLYKRRMPKNAIEACKILITHGASRYYQRIGQWSQIREHYGAEHLIADDMLRDIFPGMAPILTRLFKWDPKDQRLKQFKVVDEPRNKKSDCALM